MSRNPSLSRSGKRSGPALVLFCMAALTTSCAIKGFEPRGFVYAYGITDYDIYVEDGTGSFYGYLKNLDVTAKDAFDIYSLFSGHGYEAHLRINNGGEYSGLEAQPATMQQLAADIAYAAAHATRMDTVVFYFSGHGGGIPPAPGEEVSDPPNPIWLPNTGGTPVDDWFFLYSPVNVAYEDLDYYFLSDDTLAGLLGTIPAGKLVVILDSCHSGGFIGGSVTSDPWNDPYYLPNTRPSSPPGIGDLVSDWASGLSDYDVRADVAIVLAAAGELEGSWESSTNGIFTAFLLNSAESGDINGDGRVSMFEIYEYTAHNIRVKWNDKHFPEYRFHPRITGSAVDFLMF